MLHFCEQVPESSELRTLSSEVVKLAYLLGTNRSMSSTIVSGDSNADLEARPSEHATRSAQVPPSRIALSRNTPCSSWLMAESINRMVKIKGIVQWDRQGAENRPVDRAQIKKNTVWIIKGRTTEHVLVLPGDVAADDGGGDEAVEDEGGGQNHSEQGEPVQQLQLTVPVRAAQLPYQILEKKNLVKQSPKNLFSSSTLRLSVF